MHLCVSTAMGDENDVFTYVENGLRFLFPLTFVEIFLNVLYGFPRFPLDFYGFAVGHKALVTHEASLPAAQVLQVFLLFSFDLPGFL